VPGLGHAELALSLWALVSGHWSAWQAARVEVNQDIEAKKRSKQDLAQDVVDKIIDNTALTATRRGARQTKHLTPSPAVNLD
jgi:hypothetical protein